MHKKIESELVSLAHSILQMKNKEDVLALKKKAGELYEKLSVLAFVDRYVEATPSVSKEEILEKAAAMELVLDAESVVEEFEEYADAKEKIEASLEVVEKEKNIKVSAVAEKTVVVESEVEVEEVVKEAVAVEEKAIEEVIEKVVEEIKEPEAPLIEDLFSIRKEEKVVITNKNTLEQELEGTISLDLTTELFENAVRVDTPRKSLNDVFVGTSLQIGLNDRIAFVKHLFDGSQGDFNRVVSQLNSFKSEKEAIKFVTKMVKSDYNWKGKEEYEDRFISLITRKFA